jgi:endonuclease YncB( thermonuclease family)
MPEARWSGKHRALRRWLCGAASLALVSPSFAADCAPEPQGDGRVAAVIDARTLRLDDGRAIRLSGLAPLHGKDAEQAAAALAAIVIGRAVSLHGYDDAPDRYGRQRAWVFREGDADPLQATLIAAGAGIRDGAPSEPECHRSLESAENAARQARLGLWGASNFPKSAESPDDISTEIGHFSVIEGRVRSVRQAGGVTYLNFGRRWIEGFAVMVPARAVAAFETAGLALKGLEGKRLRARGYVTKRGGPRIEARSPEQVEVLGGGGAVATAGTVN